MTTAHRVAAALLALLPGGLAVYLGFHTGGFFAGAQAAVAVLLLVVLVVGTAQARAPFDGFGPALAIAVGAMALLATWTLASAAWSDAPGRALTEFDRTLIYGLGLAVAGSLAGGPDRVRWVVRGVALGFVVVCAAGFLSRALPEVFPTDPTIHNERLSFPLTYWNALGLMAALGLVLCSHLASSLREHRAVRVAGAAAVPLLAATLLFTYSRGALGVCILGVLAYAVLGRPRGLPAAVLAVGPPVAVALVVTYGADALATTHPTTPVAVDQGHDVALAVAACMLIAGLVRWLLGPLDSRMERARLSARARRPLLGTAAVAVLAAVVASLALHVPESIGDKYEGFVSGKESTAVQGGDPRGRLTDPDSNGRIDLWDVALKGLDESAATGSGAGTFAILWTRHRPTRDFATEAHSLYLEQLGELGVIGLILLLVAVGAIFVGTAVRIRGPDRALAAVVFAVFLAWAIRAGLDWDWEMPALTLPVFMLAGAGMARPPREGTERRPGRTARLLACLGLLVLAVTPVLVGLSQARLDSGVKAFKRGDCAKAIDAALDSIDYLSARPDGYELLAYCDVRAGQRKLALDAMDEAIDRDPENWELHYGSALVHGALGLDPRPELRRAHELDPRNLLIREASAQLRGDDPDAWRRAAATLRLPIR